MIACLKVSDITSAHAISLYSPDFQQRQPGVLGGRERPPLSSGFSAARQLVMVAGFCPPLIQGGSSPVFQRDVHAGFRIVVCGLGYVAGPNHLRRLEWQVISRALMGSVKAFLMLPLSFFTPDSYGLLTVPVPLSPASMYPYSAIAVLISSRSGTRSCPGKLQRSCSSFSSLFRTVAVVVSAIPHEVEALLGTRSEEYAVISRALQ